MQELGNDEMTSDLAEEYKYKYVHIQIIEVYGKYWCVQIKYIKRREHKRKYKAAPHIRRVCYLTKQQYVHSSAKNVNRIWIPT